MSFETAGDGRGATASSKETNRMAAPSAYRNRDVFPTCRKYPTRNGQETAPMLQAKLRRLSAAALRSGFASATRRFAAGIVTPKPAPYEQIETIPRSHVPSGKVEMPNAIKMRPIAITARYPNRGTSIPEHKTPTVDAKNWAMNSSPA